MKSSINSICRSLDKMIKGKVSHLTVHLRRIRNMSQGNKDVRENCTTAPLNFSTTMQVWGTEGINNFFG